MTGSVDSEEKSIPDITKKDAVFETVFWPNRKEGSRFLFRATHAAGKRASKVILSNDRRIQPARPCKVRVLRVDRKSAEGRGFVEVEFVSMVGMSLDDSVYVDKDVAQKLQALLESGFNILLDGPQGSGKTVLSKTLAEALSLEYVYFNCAAVFEATDFIASLQIKAGERGTAETVWVPTDIYRALKAAQADPARRFLVFLDELNRCREMARNGIMPALDATRKVFDPLTGSFLDIPDTIQWVAAVNTGLEFTGATAIDPAQLDRFAPLRISYPPESEEVRILARRNPSVPQPLLAKIVAIANRVRTEEALSSGLSVRATDEAAKLLSHPNFAEMGAKALPTILETSFCGRFRGHPKDPASDAGIVWGIIGKHLADA